MSACLLVEDHLYLPACWVGSSLLDSWDRVICLPDCQVGVISVCLLAGVVVISVCLLTGSGSHVCLIGRWGSSLLDSWVMVISILLGGVISVCMLTG